MTMQRVNKRNTHHNLAARQGQPPTTTSEGANGSGAGAGNGEGSGGTGSSTSAASSPPVTTSSSAPGMSASNCVPRIVNDNISHYLPYRTNYHSYHGYYELDAASAYHVLH